MRVRDKEEAAEGAKDDEEVQDVEGEHIVTDCLHKNEGSESTSVSLCRSGWRVVLSRRK